MEIISRSEDETLELGESIGRRLPPGAVVALVGEMGSGKTRFAKGVARGIGIDPNDVVSPTFTVCRVHEGARRLFHIDAFRLSGPAEFDDLALLDGLGDGVALVEWADRVEEALPAGTVLVRFEVMGESERRVEWTPGTGG